jgi:hypothetical protein
MLNIAQIIKVNCKTDIFLSDSMILKCNIARSLFSEWSIQSIHNLYTKKNRHANMWKLHVCVWNSHACVSNFKHVFAKTRLSVILTHTSVTSVRRVRFSHVKCDFDTHECHFHTYNCDLDTHECDYDTNVLLQHVACDLKWLIYNSRTKMHFVGLKMQFCRTKNVRLNIRNVGLNWFLSD